MKKIAVVGCWHLGVVTAACMSKWYEVIGWDKSEEVVDQLNDNNPIVIEPNLTDLLSLPNLRFTTKTPDVGNAEMIWICHDTKGNEHDVSDVDSVLIDARMCLGWAEPGTLVLVSAQLPVGTISILEQDFPHLIFVSVPENLQLGKAVDRFLNPDHLVVGTRKPKHKKLVEPYLLKLTDNIHWMSIESAEMLKHARNTFLAMSVAFANEIATLCETVGASGLDVGKALKQDTRIGKGAYVRPGGPFAGGTLARDVVSLNQLGQRKGTVTPVVSSIIPSNNRHKQWAVTQLEQTIGKGFGSVSGEHVAILGLTYKHDTDTLRGSAAVELAKTLHLKGASVTAYDPNIKALPADLAPKCKLEKTGPAALCGAAAVVIGNHHPEFASDDMRALYSNKVLIDPDGFLDGAECLVYCKYGERREGDELQP